MQHIHLVMCSICLLSIPAAAVRLLSPASYVEIKPNAYALLFADPWVYVLGSFVSMLYCGLPSSVSFVLELKTFFAYRRLTKEMRKKYRHDFLLLGMFVTASMPATFTSC